MKKSVMLIGVIVLISFFLLGCGKTTVDQTTNTPVISDSDGLDELNDEDSIPPSEGLPVELPTEESGGEVEETSAEGSEEVVSASNGSELDSSAPETTPTSVPSNTSDSLSAPLPISSSQTHHVQFNESGFVPTKLTIKTGDTIVWTNARQKVKALLLGSQSCSHIRSEMLNQGENFRWTFPEPIRCPFVDGIYVTAMMTLVVE